MSSTMALKGGPGNPDLHDEEITIEAVVQKLNRRLLPLFLAVVCFCYLDRTAVAFSALQMCHLDWFSPALFGAGSGIFYLGYVLFQVPSNLILTRAGPSNWLSAIVGAWGAVAASMAAVAGPAAFLALRFMLGLTEAGSFPAMWYLLSLYYPDGRLTVPYAMLEAFASISLALSAPLAAGVLALSGLAGLQGWQWLFLLEGLPSVGMALVLRWQLPNRVQDAHFLTPGELQVLQRDKAERRAPEEHHLDGGSDAIGWDTFRATLSNPCLWYLALTKCFKDVAFSTLMYWTPILVGSIANGTTLGDHDRNPGSRAHTCNSSHTGESRVALLVTIPYAVAACTALLLGWSSQRRQEHRLHVAVPLVVAGMVTMLLPALMRISMVGAFAALTLVVAVSNGNNGVFNSWVAHTNSGRRTAIAMPFMNSCGNMGSLVGPAAFGLVVQTTGSHAAGLLMVGLAMGGAGVLASFYDRFSSAVDSRYRPLQAGDGDIEVAALQRGRKLELGGEGGAVAQGGGGVNGTHAQTSLATGLKQEHT